MTDFPTLDASQVASYLWPPFSMDDVSLAEFQERILAFYAAHGRRFIWRESSDPYHILLSEVMLQQTQTSRALPKYELFLSLWPTLEDLASATVLEVLTHWKGLGYNRRALYLLECAKRSQAWGWTLPDNEVELLTLPGVGKATAAALLAFSFNKPSLYLETNIRAVIIHSFFADSEGVKDRQIEEVLSRLLTGISDYKSWYYALMDYGVLLKGLLPNPNRRSAHYNRQGSFENSNRQIRGLLIHHLTEGGPKDGALILSSLGRFEEERVRYCLEALEREGFVQEEGGVYSIKRT